MPKKPAAAKRKTSPSDPYYKQYKNMVKPFLALTKKQFQLQSESTKAILLGLPASTFLNDVYTTAPKLPQHSQKDLDLAKKAKDRRSVPSKGTLFSSYGSLSKERRDCLIKICMTPPEAYIKPSDLRRLSFWQKVRFLLNTLFRKGTK